MKQNRILFTSKYPKLQEKQVIRNIKSWTYLRAGHKTQLQNTTVLIKEEKNQLKKKKIELILLFSKLLVIIFWVKISSFTDLFGRNPP